MTAPSDKLAALVALDQANPQAFGVKFRLGELYLSLGEVDVASVYLKAANDLRRTRGVAAEESRAANLEYARTLLLQGKAADAIPVVMPAAKAGDVDALLVRARAYVQTGDAKSALNDFQTAWKSPASTRGAADYSLYAQALASQERYADALAVLQESENTLGFQPGGMGLLESSVLEKLGRTAPSLLAAFKETLYQVSQDTISIAQVDTNLSALATRSDVPGIIDARGQALLRGLKAYLHGSWSDALAALSRGLAGEDDPFGRFLVLSSTLEAGAVTPALLSQYGALETRYHNYPAYYWHLWRAMKKGPGDFTLAVGRGVLECTILLAPRSAEAADSRKELGRLIGVDAAQSRFILVNTELDDVYARLLAGADPALVLPPVMDLLSITKENVYASAGLLMVRTAMAIPAVSAYVRDRLKTASGPLKDRLSQVQ